MWSDSSRDPLAAHLAQLDLIGIKQVRVAMQTARNCDLLQGVAAQLVARADEADQPPRGAGLRIADAADGFLFYAPLDVVLADHSVVQPDLIYFSAARVPNLSKRIEVAPDLVVELETNYGGQSRVSELAARDMTRLLMQSSHRMTSPVQAIRDLAGLADSARGVRLRLGAMDDIKTTWPGRLP